MYLSISLPSEIWKEASNLLFIEVIISLDDTLPKQLSLNGTGNNVLKKLIAYSSASAAFSLNLAASCTRLSTSCWKNTGNLGMGKLAILLAFNVGITEPYVLVVSNSLPYLDARYAYNIPSLIFCGITRITC